MCTAPEARDTVTPSTQVVLCTVGILLKVMGVNPNLEGTALPREPNASSLGI